MDKTIWKYELNIRDKQTVIMPKDAKIVSIQTQGHAASIWAIVDPEAETEEVEFHMFGTGHPISDEEYKRRYIGTIQIRSSVFHCFQKID